VRKLGIPFSSVKALFFVREFDARGEEAGTASDAYLARRTMAPLLDVLEEMDMLARLHRDGLLSDDEFARRAKPRSQNEMEADASFKLAVYFHETKNNELAEKYWAKAQQLNPDDWNYHRQQWSFTPQEAGKKWLEKFQKTEQPYYPKLDMPRSEPSESQRQ